MNYPCPLILVLLLLLAPSSAPAEPETRRPSIQFWRQPSYVFLPSDMRLELSFKILRLGHDVQSGASVRVQLWTPNHKLDPVAKLATFALRDVCNSSSTPRELHCQASLDCRAIGLHHGFWTTAKLRLEDEQGSAISEHQTGIWIRSVLTPAVLEPPSCWRAEEPLRMQDPDCVWLWMSFKPNQNVVLSLQDFGPPEPPREDFASLPGSTEANEKVGARHADLTGARSLHEGSWTLLVAQLSGRNQVDDDLLSCLPPVGFVLPMHGSCAVVGSAWHLDHSNFGAEIDAHEVVLRVNDPPIEEWAEHVGSRTTHRLLNGVQKWEHYPEGEQLIFRLHRDLNVAPLVDACKARRLRPVALSPSFIYNAHTAYAGAVHRSQAFILTTGFTAVMWALHACESVTVYGMGGGASEQNQGMVQYNYHSHQPRNANYFHPAHSWDDESIILMRLEKAGALRRRFREDVDEELRCATLGETAELYRPTPQNVEAHARICHSEAVHDDDGEIPELDGSDDTVLAEPTAPVEETPSRRSHHVPHTSDDGQDQVPAEPRPQAPVENSTCETYSRGKGRAGVDLYDCLYQGWYMRANSKMGGQDVILHDLLMYDGPDSPLIVRPAVVLDAGAGVGVAIHWLRDTQKVMEVEAHGVELSGVAVESSPWPELTQLQLLRQGSLAHLTFPDRTFDLVFSHEVLEHVPKTDVPRILKELVRVSRGRLFFTISLRLSNHDDPAAPHLHVTVQPRGWWDERMADEGCVPDLDLLGFMWRDPAAKHDDHRQWMPYRDPWMFAYKCAVGGDAAAAEAEAHAELQAMRRIPEGCAQHAAAAQSEQLGEVEGCSADGWADVFDPAVYWATDAAKPKETMHKQYLAFLADRFGMVLGSDV